MHESQQTQMFRLSCTVLLLQVVWLLGFCAAADCNLIDVCQHSPPEQPVSQEITIFTSVPLFPGQEITIFTSVPLFPGD